MSIVLILILFSNAVFSTVQKQEFSLVNNAITKSFSPTIYVQTNFNLELKEIYENYGGAFLVDSLRKPMGEEKFILTLTGQTAQNQHISLDGYAIVACHEIGHILGGEPRQKRALSNWSSVEGQADFYATKECMWEYIKLINYDLQNDIHSEVFKLCNEIYGFSFDKMNGCLRIFSGILSMQEYFNTNNQNKEEISIFKKDSTIAKSTLEKYGSNQCRIDTMIAGLFNQKRPACWFKE